jgi:hypothetical protein
MSKRVPAAFLALGSIVALIVLGIDKKDSQVVRRSGALEALQQFTFARLSE